MEGGPVAFGDGDAVGAAVGLDAPFGVTGYQDFVVAGRRGSGFHQCYQVLEAGGEFFNRHEAGYVDGEEGLADADGFAAKADAADFVDIAPPLRTAQRISTIMARPLPL